MRRIAHNLSIAKQTLYGVLNIGARHLRINGVRIVSLAYSAYLHAFLTSSIKLSLSSTLEINIFPTQEIHAKKF